MTDHLAAAKAAAYIAQTASGPERFRDETRSAVMHALIAIAEAIAGYQAPQPIQPKRPPDPPRRPVQLPTLAELAYVQLEHVGGTNNDDNEGGWADYPDYDAGELDA